MTTGEDSMPIEGGARIGMASAITDFHHGPPTAAPTGLTAYDAGPDARRIFWDEVENAAHV